MDNISQHKGALQLLSRKQVAEMAGVHPGTVKRWEHSGLLKANRINSRVVRYEWHEVMRFLRVEKT